MKRRRIKSIFVWPFFIGLSALCGCNSDSYKPVSLKPAPARVPSLEARQHATRLGMAPILSSRACGETLAGLCELLERKLQRSVRPFFGQDYKEINDMLVLGQLDAAVVCTGAYVDPRLAENTTVLLVPTLRQGNIYYHGVVLVRKKARFKDFADLQGASAAFTDTLSLTGYLYPLSRACALSGGARNFFGSSIFTHSHDRSIKMAASGLVDVAFVDGTVWRWWRKRHPRRAIALRVLETSPPFPAPPIVVSKRLSSEAIEKLRRAFLAVAAEREGRSILKAMGWSGLVVPDKAYLRRLDETRKHLGSLRENACISP